jgi:hypothetical protein
MKLRSFKKGLGVVVVAEVASLWVAPLCFVLVARSRSRFYKLGSDRLSYLTDTGDGSVPQSRMS